MNYLGKFIFIASIILLFYIENTCSMATLMQSEFKNLEDDQENIQGSSLKISGGGGMGAAPSASGYRARAALGRTCRCLSTS